MNKELVNCLVNGDTVLVNFGTHESVCGVVYRTMEGRVLVSEDNEDDPFLVNAESILSAQRPSYRDRSKTPTMINLPL